MIYRARCLSECLFAYIVSLNTFFAPRLRTHVVGMHLRDVYHTTEHKQTQVECAQAVSQGGAFYVASDTLAWRRASLQLLGSSRVFFNHHMEDSDLGDDPQ